AAVERGNDGIAIRVHAFVRVRSEPIHARAPLATVGDAAAAGLLDREQLLASLETAQREAQRTDRHVAVLFVGVDRSKSAIASLSHRDAEYLSATIAERLRDGVREHDFVAQLDGDADSISIARMRGDEFTLLLPQLQRISDAAKVGARLVDLLSR